MDFCIDDDLDELGLQHRRQNGMNLIRANVGGLHSSSRRIRCTEAALVELFGEFMKQRCRNRTFSLTLEQNVDFLISHRADVELPFHRSKVLNQERVEFTVGTTQLVDEAAQLAERDWRRRHVIHATANES